MSRAARSRRRHPCPLFLADGAVGRAEPTELDSFRQVSGSQRARRSLRRPPSMRAFVLSYLSLSLVTHPPHPYYRRQEREHSTIHSPHSRYRTRVFSNVVSGGAVCACRVSVVLARPEPDPAPAEHATYHRTFDHIINQISDRHDQQQQGLRAWLHNQTDERQVG